jgi:predicted membrane protein
MFAFYYSLIKTQLEKNLKKKINDYIIEVCFTDNTLSFFIEDTNQQKSKVAYNDANLINQIKNVIGKHGVKKAVLGIERKTGKIVALLRFENDKLERKYL